MIHVLNEQISDFCHVCQDKLFQHCFFGIVGIRKGILNVTTDVICKQIGVIGLNTEECVHPIVFNLYPIQWIVRAPGV